LPFKLLIVEDKADSRDLLLYYFTTRGFCVITAGDGSEGFDQTLNERPDLIITDLTMPKVGGIEMIKLIRSQPKLADIPIIVYTAYGKGFITSAVEAGANQVFSKPVNLEKLAQSVSLLLDQPTATGKTS
jgi:CheY-like chemotaxis protein